MGLLIFTKGAISLAIAALGTRQGAPLPVQSPATPMIHCSADLSEKAMMVAAPAFEKIYRERRDLYLRVLTRRVGDNQIAEEILQDAFLQVSQLSHQEDITNPDGYLMKVAINRSTDWIRQETSRRRREQDWVQSNTAFMASGEAAAAEPAADQALIARDELAQLRQMLETLSSPVRTAFILHKINGLSHDETARKMGLSKSTVEKHIMKAMRHVLDGAAMRAGTG